MYSPQPDHYKQHCSSIPLSRNAQTAFNIINNRNQLSYGQTMALSGFSRWNLFTQQHYTTKARYRPSIPTNDQHQNIHSKKVIYLTQRLYRKSRTEKRERLDGRLDTELRREPKHDILDSVKDKIRYIPHESNDQKPKKQRVSRFAALTRLEWRGNTPVWVNEPAPLDGSERAITNAKYSQVNLQSKSEAYLRQKEEKMAALEEKRWEEESLQNIAEVEESEVDGPSESASTGINAMTGQQNRYVSDIGSDEQKVQGGADLFGVGSGRPDHHTEASIYRIINARDTPQPPPTSIHLENRVTGYPHMQQATPNPHTNTHTDTHTARPSSFDELDQDPEDPHTQHLRTTPPPPRPDWDLDASLASLDSLTRLKKRLGSGTAQLTPHGALHVMHGLVHNRKVLVSQEVFTLAQIQNLVEKLIETHVVNWAPNDVARAFVCAGRIGIMDTQAGADMHNILLSHVDSLHVMSLAAIPVHVVPDTELGAKLGTACHMAALDKLTAAHGAKAADCVRLLRYLQITQQVADYTKDDYIAIYRRYVPLIRSANAVDVVQALGECRLLKVALFKTVRVETVGRLCEVWAECDAVTLSRAFTYLVHGRYVHGHLMTLLAKQLTQQILPAHPTWAAPYEAPKGPLRAKDIKKIIQESQLSVPPDSVPRHAPTAAVTQHGHSTGATETVEQQTVNAFVRTMSVFCQLGVPLPDTLREAAEIALASQQRALSVGSESTLLSMSESVTVVHALMQDALISGRTLSDNDVRLARGALSDGNVLYSPDLNATHNTWKQLYLSNVYFPVASPDPNTPGLLAPDAAQMCRELWEGCREDPVGSNRIPADYLRAYPRLVRSLLKEFGVPGVVVDSQVHKELGQVLDIVILPRAGAAQTTSGAPGAGAGAVGGVKCAILFTKADQSSMSLEQQLLGHSQATTKYLQSQGWYVVNITNQKSYWACYKLEKQQQVIREALLPYLTAYRKAAGLQPRLNVDVAAEDKLWEEQDEYAALNRQLCTYTQ